MCLLGVHQTADSPAGSIAPTFHIHNSSRYAPYVVYHPTMSRRPALTYLCLIVAMLVAGATIVTAP
jgi:membrane-associated PAP2 superfamily phosphatase